LNHVCADLRHGCEKEARVSRAKFFCGFAMKRLLPITVFALFVLTEAAAGTITGTIEARGAPDGEQAAGDGKYESRRYKFVEKLDYTQLRDFVVYIEGPMSQIAPASAAPLAVTTQKDASFDPHVLPIMVGTTVRWPNEDDIFHNVFSMSETKEFNLGLYHKERTPDITFDKAGRVDVFCAIHSKMHCIILVLPNPYFAMADARRRYVIKDVPAGTYKLKAWQERLPGQVKDVVVPEQGEVKVNFILGLDELPKY